MIREATEQDFDDIWFIFQSVVKTGTSYVYSPHTTKDEAHRIWMTLPKKTFVMVDDNGRIQGTYYIKQNRPDLGSHVCRCGYMVHTSARRQGVGEAMCRHSLAIAPSLGFRGMQLTYVVSTNIASVALWKKMGFTQVGRVPNAYQHAEFGDVDVLIFYQSLTN